jgi:hypothetical protein
MQEPAIAKNAAAAVKKKNVQEPAVAKKKKNRKNNESEPKPADLVTHKPKEKIYRLQEFYVNCCRTGTAAEAILKWRDMEEEDREPFRVLCRQHNSRLQTDSRAADARP